MATSTRECTSAIWYRPGHGAFFDHPPRLPGRRPVLGAGNSSSEVPLARELDWGLPDPPGSSGGTIAARLQRGAGLRQARRGPGPSRSPADRPFPYRLLNCAAQVGANLQGSALGLDAPKNEAYLGTALADAPAPIVGMVPGAEQPTKRWGSSGFGELAVRLSKRGASIVLLGGPAERDLAEEVRVKAQLPPGRNLAGNSIPESIAVLSRCDVVVGGDTGLVHCARALGIPVVMIFGPTPPGRHLFSERERPVHLALDCQPCHRSGQARCPLGHHRCMVDLSVAEVEQALGHLWPQLGIRREEA